MLRIIEKYYPLFLKGVGFTLLLAVVGTLGGFLISLLLVDARNQETDERRDNLFVKIAKFLTRWFSIIYTTVFRGTPMIVQAMIFYYGISMIVSMPWWTPLTAGLIIVTLNTAAYIAEVIRGSVNAIDIGQMEAARSLGFSRRQALFLVIYPQAIKNALPAIGNEFVVNLKDTAVLSVIGVLDLFNATRQIVGATYEVVIPFFITAVIYLLLTGLTSIAIGKMETKQKVTAKKNG